MARRSGFGRRAGVFGGLALVLPLLATPGLAATTSPSASPGVRLTTSIALLQSTRTDSGELSIYEVTVRPAGGVAKGTQVQVAVDAPARWQGYSAPCRRSERAGNLLDCSLGDLSGPASVRGTLAVPAGSGRLGMLAITDAGNAPVWRTATVLTEPSPGSPPVPARSAPRPSPSPARRSASVRPSSSPAGRSASVRPSSSPAGRSASVRPRRAYPWRPRPRLALPQTPVLHPIHSVPQSPVLRPIQPVPPMWAAQPVQPVQPVQPPGAGLQGAVGSGAQYPSSEPAGGTAPSGGLSLPALPSSTPAVASPSPRTTASPSADPVQDGDTSQLSLVTASDVPGGHAAWVKVLGVVVVAEVSVLWLATSLGLWRRRMAAAAASGLAATPRRRPGFAGRLVGALPRPLFRR